MCGTKFLPMRSLFIILTSLYSLNDHFHWSSMSFLPLYLSLHFDSFHSHADSKNSQTMKILEKPQTSLWQRWLKLKKIHVDRKIIWSKKNVKEIAIITNNVFINITKNLDLKSSKKYTKKI